mmetsp:Transcript_18314/g.50010  ORF Transcript_18314/g.50010 Transcript_18314/m.50010 type:complete len:89 (-) Transcript_18314:4155-4421(-)
MFSLPAISQSEETANLHEVKEVLSNEISHGERKQEKWDSNCIHNVGVDDPMRKHHGHDLQVRNNSSHKTKYNHKGSKVQYHTTKPQRG